MKEGDEGEEKRKRKKVLKEVAASLLDLRANKRQKSASYCYCYGHWSVSLLQGSFASTSRRFDSLLVSSKSAFQAQSASK